MTDQTGYRYLTGAQALWENGERHVRNARKHVDAGRPQWALGSLKKAMRNFEKSCLLTPDPILAEMMVRFHAQVAKDIFGMADGLLIRPHQ